MKIGIDARPLSYQLTGIGLYLKCILDKLQKLDLNNEYYLISNRSIQYKLMNQRWHKIEGSIQKKMMSSPWMQIVGPYYANKLGFDIFWGTRHHIPLLLPKRIKSVLTIHDTVHKRYPETMQYRNLILERMLMGRSIEKSHMVIAVSKSTARDIEHYFSIQSNKIKVIHSSIPDFSAGEVEILANEVNLPNKYLLFVGTLEPRKNFELLFSAFNKINHRIKDLHLVCVGDFGWRNKRILSKIRIHSLRDKIHFFGYVPRKSLKTIYKKSICFIFPSLYEGFGFPVLEAMSCGTPVIASDKSSLPEICGDAALLCDPHNVDDLAGKIIQLVENKKLRDKLRDKGYRRLKKFSWEQTAREINDLFNRVMAN